VKTAKKTVAVKESTGNVFADLHLPNPDEALAKAKLAHRICAVLNERGLTQTRAAEILGLDQPKISALMRGKLSGFSTERLFRFLNDLGQEVDIIIRPTQRADSRGDVHVHQG
jgi:predicted XRE-type DNA-binding protein